MNERWVKFLYAVVEAAYQDVMAVLEDKNIEKSLSARALYKLNRIRLGTHLAIHQTKHLIEPENNVDQEKENGTKD